MKEKDTDITHGSGDMRKVSGQYTFHLHRVLNDRQQPIAWSLTLNGAYATSDNHGEAAQLIPRELLNASVNISHVRPLSPKWSMFVTLGAGVYSAPQEIRWNSVLVNGGLIFMRQCGHHFSFGVGAGLTNSYGVPIVMPMTVINWRLSGKYEVAVNLSNGADVSAGVRLGDRFRLKCQLIEMDGMASVLKVDGRSMIYSTFVMRSFLRPEYRVGKRSTLYMGVGGAWLRNASLTKRSLKDFFKNFAGNNADSYRFGVSGYLTMGFQYGF